MEISVYRFERYAASGKYNVSEDTVQQIIKLIFHIPSLPETPGGSKKFGHHKKNPNTIDNDDYPPEFEPWLVTEFQNQYDEAVDCLKTRSNDKKAPIRNAAKQAAIEAGIFFLILIF